MKEKENKMFCHHNTWWWGETFHIIGNDGVGVVEVQFDKSMPNVAYVTGLSVVDHFRRQGIATALMAACERLAIDKEKAFLQVSVEKDNVWLQEWYKRLGFVIFNEEEHTFLMLKALYITDMSVSCDNGYYSADLSTTFGYGDEEGGEQ